MAANSELQILVSLKDMATKGVQNIGSSLEEMGQKSHMASLMIAAGATAAAVGIGYILKKTGEMEQTKVGFATLLGSGKKAQDLISDLQQLAASTPFEFPGLAKLTQRFLAVGYNAEEAKSKLIGVGEAASAMAVGQQGAEQITLALTQMAARGQVTGQEMIQLSNVGINGFKLLADQTGIAETKLRELSEKGMLDGKKAVDLMIAAFKQDFAGSMKAQSETLLGKLSTLTDSLKTSAVTIGNMFLPQVKEMVSGLIVVTEKVGAFINEHKNAIAVLVKWVAIIGTAFAAIVMAQSGVTMLISGVKLLSGAFFAGGPVMIGIKLALIAAAAASVYLTDKFGSLGNAFKAIGLAFAVTGNVLLAGFKILGNKIVDFLNSMAAPIGKFYNWIAEKAAKLGVDMGNMDLHIDFKFDSAGNMNKAIQEVGQIDKIMADAKSKKVTGDIQSSASEKNLAASMKLTEEQMKKNADALMKAGEAKDKAGEKAKKLKETITKLSDEYKNLKNKGKESLQELSDTHNEKMKSIQDDITKTRKALSDLTKAFNQGEASDRKSVAEQIVETEQKMADLKNQIAEETDDKKRALLQAELEKEQKAYNESAGFIKTIDASVIEARRRASLTELQRAVEDFQQKRLLAQQEYTEKTAQLQAELTALQNKEAQEIALYKEKQKQITEMMAAADKSYKDTLASQTKATEEAVNTQIKYFNELASAIAKVQQAQTSAQITVASTNVSSSKTVAGKRAFGGPVMSGLTYLVGEKGPELFTPNQSGNITSNDRIAGKTVNINITGNTLLDRDSARKMGDLIIKQLKLNYSL